ncbi:MAG: peptide ABC transporter substrate-binding protein [Pseudomonadota bacterium]
MDRSPDLRGRRPRTLSAACLAATLLLLAACGKPEAPTQAPGAAGPVATDPGPLRRGLGGEVSTLDPQSLGDAYSEQIARDLYEGLTAHAPDGSVVPGAAAEWSVTGDGLVYTFRLRDGARWSNGEHVTAADFVAGLRRAVTPATGAPTADGLRVIAGAADVLAGRRPPATLGVEAPDPRTVVIRLERPAPYLLDLLTAPVAFPLHRPSLGPDGTLDTKPGRLVSNGAYVLETLVPGDRLRLVRNPRYWNAAATAVAAVEYLMIADVDAELRRYRAGDLDVTSTLPATQLAWARAERPAELQVGAAQALSLIVFDTTEGPLARHPALREALALALDREALVERVLKAGQLPWYSMVSPGLGGYAPAEYTWAREPAAERIARARALVRSAGYGPHRPLRLRVLHHQNENNRNTALAAGAWWKERLGVEVEFVEREFRTFLALRRHRAAWDAMVTAVTADYLDPGSLLSMFRSDAPDNDTGLADAEFDALLDRAGASPEIPRRHELYRAAETRLLGRYAATPVYVIVNRRLVAPRVEGAVLTPANRTYTRHLRWRAARPYG